MWSSHRGHLYPSSFSAFIVLPFLQILFEQVQKPRSMIVGCPKLAQLTIQVDQHFENRGFDFYVFNEAIEPREIIHHDAANSFTVIWHGVSSWWQFVGGLRGVRPYSRASSSMRRSISSFVTSCGSVEDNSVSIALIICAHALAASCRSSEG